MRRSRIFGGSHEARGMRALPLVLRVGLSLGAIAGLALFTMIASIMIADTARDDAAAINQAGSLRMQTYRMLNLARQGDEQQGLQEAMNHFERNLKSPALQAELVDSDSALARKHGEITGLWTNQLQPALKNDEANAATAADAFVAELNTLVATLQQHAETRIELLRLIQGIAIFLTIALVFATMYSLNTGLVGPLRELKRAAVRVRRGDMSVRVTHTGEDELGAMGRAFNTMAESLEGMHGQLERDVRVKTQHLRRSNEALKLLYELARSMTPDGPEARNLQRTITRLAEVVGTGTVWLCLNGEGQSGDQWICSDSGERDASAMPSHRPGRPGKGSEPGEIHVPLLDGETRLGALFVQHGPGDIPEPWKLRLLEAVADQIATGLARGRQSREQRRLSLLEERAIIARELHDSLAQSLSYLKIQLSRLQTLEQRQEHDRIPAVLAELRHGLNAAYRHLRDLIANFRLSVDEPDLETALKATVREFARQGGIPVGLDIRMNGHRLDANAEVHLIHVAREALTNVLHHANAREAAVTLTLSQERGIELLIDDDGCGIPEHYERVHHFGTRIMQERARHLGGLCSVETRPGGGTRVRLQCPLDTDTEARTGTNA
ncbi:two-component system nitrate/nitrite sensor histidine kinase NarX [Natronocella acetinitrilica]|uniref:Sensor protein n=1 Tax=Natronocella acetinitrilica TaxID=414046 RepID=A0AAE3G0U3_9GAMM|nr:HAMP domain-containing protein [Natronocella acetinitrilica]MCP1673531.1 two-component system nitrate/nitrite sensor histidine kinase NarX [Natronocella acetinitrilica]